MTRPLASVSLANTPCVAMVSVVFSCVAKLSTTALGGVGATLMVATAVLLAPVLSFTA